MILSLLTICTIGALSSLYHTHNKSTHHHPLSIINPSSSNPTTHHHRHLASGETQNVAWPNLAWLISFRGSGGPYTLQLLRVVTERTTGTNYGPDLEQRHTLYRFAAYSPSGPFRHDKREFPSDMVVVGSHCTDYCTKCNRAGFYALDADEFLKWCASGNQLLPPEEKKVEVTNNPYVYNPYSYQPDVPAVVEEKEEDNTFVDPFAEDEALQYIVKDEEGKPLIRKVVHLIENPYRNIVNRFRDAVTMYGEEGDPHNENKLYPRTIEGFREWCQKMDDFFYMQEFILYNMDVVTAIKRIPCHSEFLLYAMWHNAAFELKPKLQLDVTQLHTEDFYHDMPGNIERLTRMFNLQRIPEKAPPEYEHFDYSSFYTTEEKVLISSFLKVTASQDTWMSLKRYLPPPELSDTDAFQHVGSILSPQHFGEWPAIAWLMSFPNSGTFFTTQLLQIASRTTTATNYAPEVGPRYTDIPNFQRAREGPFRTSTRALPKKFILTKTHCSGRCIECAPKDYYVTAEDFVNGCSHGARFGPGGQGAEAVQYGTYIVKKAVHLIRNPFDNVVARFHFAYKSHKAAGDLAQWGDFSYDKEGFKKWCHHWDNKFIDEEMEIFGKEVFDKMREVPCHAEFYSYVQWHNNAFKAPEKANVPSYVVYYEEFATNLQSILNDLLKFLELPLLGRVNEFHYSGGYPAYYDNDERVKIVEFIKLVGSHKTFEALKRYF